MNILSKSFIVGAAVALGAMGCNSDSGVGDGSVSNLDGSTSADTATGPSYLPVSGKYKVTGYTAGSSDGCMIGASALNGDTDPTHWIPVTVSSTGSITIGNAKGTPAMASLGEGTLSSDMSTITRSNHYAVGMGSPCQYDDVVTSVITLDDPTNKTFGLGVTEKQSNRSMCSEPAGVGTTCTSTWSWRMTFGQ